MKKWTDQNYFNKGQAKDVDPTLSDNQSFINLKNGRLIQEGGKDFSIQNLIGDGPVSDGGFGFTGNSNFWEIKVRGNLDLSSTITDTINIIDPSESSLSCSISVAAPGDTLSLYEEVANQIRTTIEGATLSTYHKHYKVAYDNVRVVIWYDDYSTNTGSNYRDNNISIVSGNFIKNRYIGRCEKFQPIAYKEFQNELIVVAVGLNGNTIYNDDVGAENVSEFITSQYSVPYSPNITGVWQIKFNDNGTFASTKLLYCNYLNNKLDKILDLDGSEENSELVRIYMVDGLNPKRFLNLRDPNLMVLEPEEIEVFPEVSFSQPILKEVKENGQLPVCVVQYVYSLVTQTGAETVISPASQMIPLGAFSDTQKTKGGEPTSNSGKSVTIRIEEVNTNFNRIKLYALYSFSGDSIDAVELINEREITDPNLEFTHFEYARGQQFTYEQLLSVNNGFKYGKHLESADGRLFVANLSNDIPNLNDWDTLVKQYNAAGETYSGDHNPDPSVYKYLPNGFRNIQGRFLKNIDGAETVGFSSNNSGIRLAFKIKDIPIEDFPGGNQNPSQFQGIWDSTKIYFTNDVVKLSGVYYISVLSANSINQNFNPETNRNAWSLYNSYINLEQKSNQFDIGYTQKSTQIEYLQYFPENPASKSPLYYGDQQGNFTSPHFHHRMAGYTPGETYRIGILPRDKQGNPLEVKYIGDIKVPEYEDPYYDFDLETQQHSFFDPNLAGRIYDHRPFVTKVLFGKKITYARVVYLNLEVKLPKSIQDQISGYEIVRSQITQADKRFIATGVLNQVSTYDNSAVPSGVFSENINGQGIEGNMNNVHGNSPFDINQLKDQSGNAQRVNTKLFTLDSPDAMVGAVSVNDEFNLQLKFIQDLDYEYTQQGIDFRNTNNGEDISNYLHVFNAGNINSQNGSAKKNTPLDVFRAVNVSPGELVPKEVINDTKDFRNNSMLIPLYFGTNGKVAGKNLALGNATIVLKLQNAANSLGITSDALLKSLMALQRKTVNSYGGRNTFSILQTQWVSTGHYTKADAPRFMHLVGGGNHYGTMFSYVKGSPQGSWARNGGGEQKMYGISTPAVSNINPNFIHGPRIFDANYNWMVIEPLLFNKVFGKENSFRIYTTEDSRIPTINQQPYSIAVSPQKINGALIDQWLKFPVFDFYEMPNSYGFITDLVSVNNALYVVQERGVSLLAIDPNALIQGEQTDILIGNGTGKVIADHKVVCNYGTSYKSSIVKFPDGFVFLDNINQCYVLVYGQQYKLLSEETSNSSIFREWFSGQTKPGDSPYTGNGFSGYYDSVFKEIITTYMS